MPRGLRHMIRILVRGYECGIEIGVDHLRNVLEIRRSSKLDKYYISNKRIWRIIGGFPSKDDSWDDYFFYVPVDEATIGNDFLNLTKTDWGPLGSSLIVLVRDPLPPVPEDIAQAKEILTARKVNWRKHFSFARVEKARALFAGAPVSSDSSASSVDTTERMVRMSIRDKKEKTERERASQAQEAETSTVRTEPNLPKASVAGGPNAEAIINTEETLVTHELNRANVSVPKKVVEIHSEVFGKAPQPRPRSLLLVVRIFLSSWDKGGSNRKRSTMDGDKGKGVTEPKKRCTILLDAEPTSSLIDDVSASASLLSKINNKGIRLPPADSLMKAKSYASMSQRGTKFLASINETIAGYEADACKDQRRIDETRKDAVTLQTKLDEAERKFSSAMAQAKTWIKALEAEKKTLKDECVKATDMAVQAIGKKDALHKANVKRAVKSARRDLTEKVRGRFSSAEKSLKDLADTKESELDLVQIDGNLQLIELLKKDDAPTLDAEAEKLKQWRADLVGADEGFERISTCLRGELNLSPVSEDSVDANLGNKSVETAAQLVGSDGFQHRNTASRRAC
ncbi:uncharacterized protein At3g60930, chloroplastic-like [Eutrema salsugineum]|uniref:uncharacterized protein At3g60930, chloroplastic-like n=1 Tax=Eutrema salsugineum TaxID=72664 RepID=UPI000CECF39C|nr:uncharacterized protein At3g60930, chloroplastic-like [Eutrema salsugineum]